MEFEKRKQQHQNQNSRNEIFARNRKRRVRNGKWNKQQQFFVWKGNKSNISLACLYWLCDGTIHIKIYILFHLQTDTRMPVILALMRIILGFSVNINFVGNGEFGRNTQTQKHIYTFFTIMFHGILFWI